MEVAMIVRRLLTTTGLLAISLLLVAFQGEPQTPAAGNSIPWLVWILLLLVALGLFYLAWMRRDIDAFDTGHDDDHNGHAHVYDVNVEGDMTGATDAGVGTAVGGAGLAMANAAGDLSDVDASVSV